MGPALFMLFVGVAVFVVLNILIAIISDSYNDEQQALMNSQVGCVATRLLSR